MPGSAGQTEELVFRMVLDPGDLNKLAGMGPGAVSGGAGGVGGGGGGGGGGMVPKKGEEMPLDEPVEVSPDPSFMSIFKPLAYMMVLGKMVGMLLMSSNVANAYLGGMGKVFSAALDMLLLPFTPIFNLILTVMMKLLGWLVTSGILEKLHAVFLRASKYLERMLEWIQEIWGALKDFDMGKLGKLVTEGIGSTIKQSIKDPLGMLAAAGTTAGLWFMASKIPGLGGLMGGFGLGKGAASLGAGGLARLGALSAGGGGALAGAGLLAGVGIGAGTAYYGWGNAGKSGAAGWGGVGTMAAGGAIAGGTIGAFAGGPLGAAVGAGAGGLIGGGIGLGKKMGWWGGGGQDGGAGAQLQNVGNTTTVNIEVNAPQMDTDELVDLFLTEITESQGALGHDVKTRSYQ